MNSLSENEYMKENVTREWLQSSGFRRNRIFSNNEVDIYTYRFPVYKYGDAYTLECELSIILQNGKINIDVYDCNTRNKYAPFYCMAFGDYSNMINQINEKIQNELKRLKIMEVVNTYESKNKENKRKRNSTKQRK